MMYIQESGCFASRTHTPTALHIPSLVCLFPTFYFVVVAFLYIFFTHVIRYHIRNRNCFHALQSFHCCNRFKQVVWYTYTQTTQIYTDIHAEHIINTDVFEHMRAQACLRMHIHVHMNGLPGCVLTYNHISTSVFYRSTNCTYSSSNNSLQNEKQCEILNLLKANKYQKSKPVN